MEFLAKRALFIASKQYYCTGRRIFHYSSGIRLSRACFYKSAYERSDQGIIKERGHDEETSDNYERASRHADDNVENMSGVAGFAADTATRVAEMAKETTMDKAWDSAKNATRDVQDTVVAAADENVVDTTEYRTIMDLNNYSDDQDHI